MKQQKIYTKDKLIEKLKEIAASGWIPNTHKGNHGGIGNTLEKKISISFDSKSVDARHGTWIKSVKQRVGLGELNPQPYWGFDDLEYKAGTKLLNCFYVQAEVKMERKREFYKYSKVMMLQKFNFEGFLKAIEEAKILVDFDARTGHNHGTKFRMRQDCMPMLYEKTAVII